MAQSNQIQKVNYTHERIMDWLLQNPDKSLRQCADEFGYTQAWLSTVIHSDAFQQQYKALQGEAHARVAADIPAKMMRIADIALDKLADKIAETEDAELILETSDKILHRLGYAPSSKAPAAPPANVNNTFIIDAGVLTAARANFGTQPQTVEGEQIVEQLPASDSV